MSPKLYTCKVHNPVRRLDIQCVNHIPINDFRTWICCGSNLFLVQNVFKPVQFCFSFVSDYGSEYYINKELSKVDCMFQKF